MNPHPIDSKLYYLFEKIKCKKSIKKIPVLNHGFDLHKLIFFFGKDKFIIEYIDEYLRINPEEINIQDKDGDTLVIKSFKYKKLLEILLKYKPDLNIKNYDGRTIMDFLISDLDCEKQNDEFEIMGILKLMLSQYIDVNYQDQYGYTLLYHSVELEEYKFLKLLMKYHANIDLETKKNKNAIKMAFQKYDIERNENLIDILLPTRKIFLENIVNQKISSLPFWKVIQCDFKIIYKLCFDFKDILRFL